MNRMGGAITRATKTRARETFLSVLAESGRVSAAAKAAKVARETFYRWREDDEEFAKSWDAALQKAYDMLEDEAVRRAADGVLRPVYQGGVKVGSVREYSDGLLTLLLKAHKPAFRDRSDVNVTGVSLADLVAGSMKRPEAE